MACKMQREWKGEERDERKEEEREKGKGCKDIIEKGIRRRRGEKDYTT